MSTKERRPAPPTQAQRKAAAGNRKRRPQPIEAPPAQPQRKAAPAKRKKPIEAPVKRSASARSAPKKPTRVAARSEVRPARRKRPVKPRQPEQKKQSTAPEVIYTPAKPLNRQRLLLGLISAAAVVLALVFGISIFFKVDTVTVTGNNKYSAWDVSQASGIRNGDNLMSLNDARISGNIISKLPYVKSVRIGINLPDTVNIYIEELDVVYALRAEDGTWWMVTAEGRVVEQVDALTAEEGTQIKGIRLRAPVVGEQAMAADIQSQSTDDQGNPILVTANGENHLATALAIARELEKNGIIGGAASIDVTSLSDMELWYGQDFRVLLGTDAQLAEKIALMKTVIDKEKATSPYARGVIDVSFTVYPGEAWVREFD